MHQHKEMRVKCVTGKEVKNGDGFCCGKEVQVPVTVPGPGAAGVAWGGVNSAIVNQTRIGSQ